MRKYSETPVAEDYDIRPVVAGGNSSRLGLVAAAGIILIGGFLVFNALRASSEPARQPTTLAQGSLASDRISSPPPLAIPLAFSANQQRAALEPVQPRSAVLQAAPLQQPASPPTILPSPPAAFFPPVPFQPLAPRPEVVFEARDQPRPEASQVGTGSGGGERVYAERFANPSTTIPRGTVIPAVLETALDSTRPGGVRALVQRDVFGFDGTQVLIQRGSRLYGEYSADLQPGQRRAMIQWTRLIRPDGVTIALDSPASDVLGRAGVKGDVDSKFFQRFGGAILQSILDIGVGVATREATDGVIVALPGSTQNLQVQQQASIQPTLKVDQGTSVSVFVARELDFSRQ